MAVVKICISHQCLKSGFCSEPIDYANVNISTNWWVCCNRRSICYCKQKRINIDLPLRIFSCCTVSWYHVILYENWLVALTLCNELGLFKIVYGIFRAIGFQIGMATVNIKDHLHLFQSLDFGHPLLIGISNWKQCLLLHFKHSLAIWQLLSICPLLMFGRLMSVFFLLVACLNTEPDHAVCMMKFAIHLLLKVKELVAHCGVPCAPKTG